jgi:hypothetical protein
MAVAVGPTTSGSSGNVVLTKALLACGVLAPLLYVVANDVVAAARYPGYDRIARPVSELSATYAPSRPVLVVLGIVFELLMIAFWIGVWRSARDNRALRTTTGLMVGFAVLGLLAFPFPMVANDEVLGANTVHTIIWGVITPLLMLAGIGVSAAAFGKRFRRYATLTLVALVALSGLAAIQAAQINAGQPAPWFGLTERALIGTWLLWIAVLAASSLLRAQSSGPTTENPASASPVAPAAPSAGPVRSSVPSPRVMHAINPFVSAILRSSLHGVLSPHVLLLTYTGRKSGRTYTLPVGYVREGDAITICSGGHRWWRNLRGGAPVSVLLRGRRRTGRAEAIEGREALVAEVEQLVESYGPKGAGRRIGVVLDAAPSREELARAMDGHAVIRVVLDA